ncbi:MAG TPA: DUF3105 domain-containing protein [Kouleothrix sp.]|nr:DUF3105 domain-containing protein [Kouleothrix sp.]
MSQSAARRASGRHAQRNKAPKSNMPLIIGGVAALIILMIAVGLSLSRNTVSVPGEQQFANQVPAPADPHINRATDAHPAYNSNPPTSGWHTGGNIGPWGVTTQPLADEITIHNLEHGGVIIHYRQDLDQATVDKLTALTRQLQQQSPCVLLIPRPTDKLDKPIAVTAWTWLIKLDTFDATAITNFFRKHVNQGPEQVGCALRS